MSLDMWKELEIKPQIDYTYYLEHTLMNVLDKLFSVGYIKHLPVLSRFGYKPTNKQCKFHPVSAPLDMTAKMISDYLAAGYTLQQIATHLSKTSVIEFMKQKAKYSQSPR